MGTTQAECLASRNRCCCCCCCSWPLCCTGSSSDHWPALPVTTPEHCFLGLGSAGLGSDASLSLLISLTMPQDQGVSSLSWTRQPAQESHVSFILLQPQGILVRGQQGIFLPTSFEACSPAPWSPGKKAVCLKDNLWSVCLLSLARVPREAGLLCPSCDSQRNLVSPS